MRLLATKKLSLSLKDRLIQHGFSVVEQPFIQIEPLAINIDSTKDHLIFTSQNAVKIAFSNAHIRPLLVGKKYYCVGEKTKSILEENGQKVIKTAQNSAKLVDFFKKTLKNERFSFFCGKLRRPEIEGFFHDYQISYDIFEIYNTTLIPKALDTTFNGILFFSPSAVSSFFKANSWKPQTQGFCIGKTTASALKKFTPNYSIAKEASEAQLFLCIHNYFTRHHAEK